MFFPPCSHPGSGPTLQTWGKAPPTPAPSFSTRTEISLKSTLLQVQEGGTPSVQAVVPPLWHSIGWGSGSLPPRMSPPPKPPAAGTPELVAGCPCSRLPGMPGQPSSCGPNAPPAQVPSIHSPALDSMAAQQLERMRTSLCASPSGVSGGWLLCGHSPSHLLVVH